MVRFEEDRCKSCGVCVAFCPKQCLAISRKINNRGHRIAGVVDEQACIACGICFTVCPDVAIYITDE